MIKKFNTISLIVVLCLCFFHNIALGWNPRSGDYKWDGKVQVNTPSSKDLWGRAGKVAMPVAEKTMKARNKRKEPLTDRQKHALRPIFGNLVDQINVRYNSKMLDKWSALGYEINLSSVDTEGQAYGYDVFVTYPKSRFSSKAADMLHLLIHEITHVQQMRDIKNTVADFGYRYFWEFKVAGLNYENNKLEREADANANKNYANAHKRYQSFSNLGSYTAKHVINFKNTVTGKYLDINGSSGQTMQSSKKYSGAFWGADDTTGGTTTFRNNCGSCKYHGWYLDIDGRTGKVILSPRKASGTYWKVINEGGGMYSYKNMGQSKYKGWYLDVDGHNGGAMLNKQRVNGALWYQH